MLQNLIVGAFFCYGMFTIQRNGFLLDKLPSLWRLFPKSLHEPLFSCGVCVSSIWGAFFLIYNFIVDYYFTVDFLMLYKMPLYLVSFGGVCAIIDRAVKFFEYGYKYTAITPLSNYSYLENMEFRDNMIMCFLSDVMKKGWKIIEVGGHTKLDYDKYHSFEKTEGRDILNAYIEGDYYVLIKGICFEGDIRGLIDLLKKSKGFIVEGSLSGDSKKQLQWIMDEFNVIKMPFITNVECSTPDHCAGDVNNRIILIYKGIDYSQVPMPIV